MHKHANQQPGFGPSCSLQGCNHCRERRDRSKSASRDQHERRSRSRSAARDMQQDPSEHGKAPASSPAEPEKGPSQFDRHAEGLLHGPPAPSRDDVSDAPAVLPADNANYRHPGLSHSPDLSPLPKPTDNAELGRPGSSLRPDLFAPPPAVQGHRPGVHTQAGQLDDGALQVPASDRPLTARQLVARIPSEELQHHGSGSLQDLELRASKSRSRSRSHSTEADGRVRNVQKASLDRTGLRGQSNLRRESHDDVTHEQMRPRSPHEGSHNEVGTPDQSLPMEKPSAMLPGQPASMHLVTAEASHDSKASDLPPAGPQQSSILAPLKPSEGRAQPASELQLPDLESGEALSRPGSAHPRFGRDSKGKRRQSRWHQEPAQADAPDKEIAAQLEKLQESAAEPVAGQDLADEHKLKEAGDDHGGVRGVRAAESPASGKLNLAAGMDDGEQGGFVSPEKSRRRSNHGDTVTSEDELARRRQRVRDNLKKKQASRSASTAI